jgi:hypothetical protein
MVGHVVSVMSEHFCNFRSKFKEKMEEYLSIYLYSASRLSFTCGINTCVSDKYVLVLPTCHYNIIDQDTSDL